MKAYFEMDNPPVKVAKIAISSGIYAAEHVTRHVPTLSLLVTFPQLIDYDPDVYEIFKDQTKLCGFEVNLSYPQTGKIRIDMPPSDPFTHTYFQLHPKATPTRRDEQESNRLQDALNCDPFRFTDVPDAVPLKRKVPHNTRAFLNDPAVRNAIYAPLFDLPFVDFHFRVLRPYEQAVNIFDNLATNATAQGVLIVLFSGNDPMFPHLGTEIVIQNTTFGGFQGFSRKPSTPWYDEEGDFAGIVHQERGWTYALFYGAGHSYPERNRMQEFILGDNKTGLVTSIQGHPAIIGGEDPSLSGVIQAAPGVHYNDSAE
ncbi:Alpha/Beta hydrolase protein [Panaeolus papilionaceus]|nr:Alpha/Beta hydrolase protein [Panaeolus papilionaceus]